MADREHESPDRDVVCPRCGARTRRRITPLGRVCEDCSRRVFTLPASVGRFLHRDAGTDRSVPRSGVIVPLFVFGVLVAMTWIVIGDGLSSFDPVVVVAAWGTFVVWGLAPSGSGDDGHRLLD